MQQYMGTCPTEMSLNGSVGSTSSWPDSRSHTTATGQLTLLSCSPQLCSKVNCSPCVKWRRSLQFSYDYSEETGINPFHLHMCTCVEQRKAPLSVTTSAVHGNTGHSLSWVLQLGAKHPGGGSSMPGYLFCTHY